MSAALTPKRTQKQPSLFGGFVADQCNYNFFTPTLINIMIFCAARGGAGGGHDDCGKTAVGVLSLLSV